MQLFMAFKEQMSNQADTEQLVLTRLGAKRVLFSLDFHILRRMIQIDSISYKKYFCLRNS